MTHLKRLSIPQTWPIPRKRLKFAVNPSPGPHAKMDCIPLRIILRDILGYADNAREAKNILSQEKVLVDKRPRKDSRFPVGLMDVVEIPSTKQYFRMITGKQGLELMKIQDKEASWKLCKIVGKTTLKGGIQQLNLHDGKNILIKKDTFKVGDSIKISLPDQRLIKDYKLEKGSHGFITAGRNIGFWGRIKEVEQREHSLEKSTVTLDTGEKEIKTLRRYIFIAEMPSKVPKPHKPDKKPKPEKKAAKPKEKK
jgi:small subunit ribosomal protein S4e